MGMKEQRQSKILSLIQKSEIETQEDLAEALKMKVLILHKLLFQEILEN